MDKDIAKCVGLWLAEGDSKASSEITFTNNCLDLVLFFNNILVSALDLNPEKIRIYTYSKDKKADFEELKQFNTKNYLDVRATKPYFIWRIYNPQKLVHWKDIVKEIKTKNLLWKDLLKGFFAGEGNLKYDIKSCSRTIRIAQGQRDLFIEEILNHLNIHHKFRIKDRSYYITGKWHWDIFAKNKLCDLHPIRGEKFWKIYNSYKEEHYPHLFLKNQILKSLKKPKKLSDLSFELKRSKARITEELIKLKKEQQASYFKIGSLTYWTCRKDLIIISKKKFSYLELLKSGINKTSYLARILDVCPKSSKNRLLELQKLGLVKHKKDKSWELVNCNKEIIII